MNGFARSTIGIVLSLSVAGPAAADTMDGLTHLAMLKETAREAIAEMLKGAPLETNQSLILRPGRPHTANWIVSDLIAAELAAEGYRVSVEEAPPAEAVAAPAAIVDTTASPLDQLRALQAAERAAQEAAAAAASEESSSASGERGPDASHRLEFRVGEFGVHYVGEGRPFFLGPKRVERAASVDLSCRLVDTATDDVVWVGGGDAVRLDRIAKSKLPLFESPGFTPAALPSRGGFRYVEPVVVGGIVAGLVYLFYTNQN